MSKILDVMEAEGFSSDVEHEGEGNSSDQQVASLMRY
jgi:hypothetical protein